MSSRPTAAGRSLNGRSARLLVAALTAALAVPSVAIAQAPSAHAATTPATVNVELQGSDNNGHVGKILSGGSASYYAHGQWHPITTTNPNNPSIAQTQLAPGTYTFAESYNGTRQQKTVTVGSSATTVYFHAALVFVELQGSDNDGHVGQILDIPHNGSASYYAGGWKPITTPDPNNNSIVQTEMLPGTHIFAATYNGTRQRKIYTVREPNPNNGHYADQTVSFGFTVVAAAPPPVYNVTLEAVTGTTTHPNVLLVPSFTDPSGYTMTVTVSSQPANGTVTKNSDGTFTYTPTAAAQNAVAYYDFAKAVATVGGSGAAPMPDPAPPTSDSFTLTADNGHGGTVSHVVTVPISPYYDIQATSNSATVRYLDDGSGLVSGQTVVVQSAPPLATSSVLNLDTSFQFSSDPSDYLGTVPTTIGSCTSDPDNANCATPPPPSNPASTQQIPPLPIHDFFGTSSAQSFLQNTIATATAGVGVGGTIAASILADFLTVTEAVVLLW